MRDEAKRGLRPYAHQDVDIISDTSQPYPPFAATVQFISQQTAQRMQNVSDKNALPFPAASYEEILRFLLKCLRANIKASGSSFKTYVATLTDSGDSLTRYR